MEPDEKRGVYNVYIVGGYVRDTLLGIKSKDIDYAVVADSFDDMKNWVSNKGKIFVSKPKYLTIRAMVNGEPRDYVLCRKDGPYSDSRHPDFTEPGTLYDDLSRRDFTVNAMAIDKNGQLIDPFNGKDDLDNRILRCVYNTEDRFREDALRMIRAMRFHITKDFSLHRDIQKCLHDSTYCNLLKHISVDRIRTELDKCLEFSTIKTIKFLGEHPQLTESCFSGRLRLLSTTKKLK